MKFAASISAIICAVALSACNTTTGANLTAPKIAPVPATTGAYYDQGLPAWHFVDVRPDTMFVFDDLPTKESGPKHGALSGNACENVHSRDVCADWKKHHKAHR